MRKKILIALASLLGIAVVLVATVFWYIRSGRLDLYLQNQIISILAESGTKATIGRTYLDLRGYKVTLEDIKLETEKEGKPFGSIGKIEVAFSVLDYLAGKISINEVIIDQPKLFVEFDEEGRFNLESLRAPESDDADKESAVKFSEALISLTNGELNMTDRKNDVALNLRNLEAKMAPQGGSLLADAINHLLTISFAQTDAVYQGRKIENIKSYIEALVVTGEANQTVDLKKLDFESDLGKATASGQITSFDPVKYDINLISDLALAEIARVFAPDMNIDGRAKFDGRVQGTDANYQMKGKIESDALAAEGFRISGIRVETDLSGSGSEYEAKAQLSSKGASGKDLSITSIVLKDATIKGKDADFDVTGGLALASLKSGKISASNVRLNLEADPDHLTLSQITASSMGGSITGSASIGYKGSASNVDVQFKSIDLAQAATLASAKDVTVRGTANGQARLAFPGLNYESATGRIVANFDASVSPPESSVETLPAKGEVVLLATGRGLHIEKAEARSAQSEVTATGDVSWRGNASLDVNFKSSDLAEAQRVVDAFGLIPENVKEDYGVAVSGPGEFTGRVEGDISAPTVTGHVKLSSIETHKDLLTPDSPPGELLGAFEGDISYTPSMLRVQNASLVRDDGSRADFNLDAPLKEENQIALKANVKDFDLAAVVRAGVPNLKDLITRGVINGTIDLRGLPGPRTLEGTADVTVTSGEFNVPSTEEGQDAKTISVPEFIGKVQIASSVLSVQDMRLQVSDTMFTGQGSFNLDTYAYTVNGEGKNIDLSELSRAASDSVQLTGRANLTIVGDGKWDEWSDINVRANVQGENVAINGRSIEAAKIEVFTDNGILKIAATGQVLDAPQTLTAEVDLRDRANYPITSTITLNDQDLSPYLQLFSPGLASVTGRATGTIKLSGPLQDTDQLQAVMNLSKLEFGGNLAEGQTYTLTNEGDVVLTATPKLINLQPVVLRGDGTRVSLGGTISAEEGLKSNLGIEGEINLRLISSFTDALDVAGLAKVKASITGALASPKLVGTTELSEVAARVPDFPLSVARGNGLLRFTVDQAIIESFKAATPGGGTLELTGGAALTNLVPDRWRIEARADQVAVEYPRDTRVIADANLSLQGNQRYQLLSGRVDIRRASYTKDIFIEDLVRGNIPFSDSISSGSVGTGGLTSSRINMDIRVNANETLVIRNNLADALGSAYVNLRGTVDNPQLAGRILLSRGTLEFRNDRYELVRGLITLPPGNVIDPILDIEAQAEISGYQVSIGFSGTLSKLETSLRSEPSLPEADIISLVLTGSPASTGSSEAAAATQTGLGLAQALLAASINEQIGRTANRLFGISRLTVDPLVVGRGNDPTARVTIGQQITRNLTLTYSQNLTSSGPSGLDRIILVEYRLSNRFSIVGFRNEGSELGFDVRVRKRF